MNYFKNTNNEVFAYDDEQVNQGYGSNMTMMSDEEVEAHLNPPKTVEEIQAEINQEALAYLASTDWYVVRFSETGVAIPDDVKAKRQEARDAII